jgi:hypothetical protein
MSGFCFLVAIACLYGWWRLKIQDEYDQENRDDDDED